MPMQTKHAVPWVIAAVAAMGLAAALYEVQRERGRQGRHPALFREFAIRSDLAEATAPILVIGDSITEGAKLPREIGGRAVVNGGISGSAPENEPATPLDIYWAFEKGFPNLGRLKAAVERLREAHFPVIVRELPAGGDDLSDDQLDELARRIDMLDRI